MSDESDSNEMDLKAFLEAATRSFTDAQRQLLQGTGVSAGMMLASAELDVKVLVEATPEGGMFVRPISFKDVTKGGIDPGMLSTLRLNLIGSADDSAVQAPIAEGGSKVPDLLGLSPKEAVAILRAQKLNYTAHAAGSDDVATASKESYGKILGQEPAAPALIDPSNEVVHFWVNLGNTPVQAIDGIGPKMETNLSKIGIRTVGDLSLADVAELAAFLRLNQDRTRDFVNMARLMSQLVILGFEDEVVEVLVKGAKIQSIDDLAVADAAELYKRCKVAVTEGGVQIPGSFSFTEKNVAEWIEAAKIAKAKLF